MKVPSAGIIFGYFFVFCAAACSADNCGPGYLGGSFRSLAPWEGGLNLVGFSRTRALEDFLGALWEALRIAKEEVEEVVDAIRVRQIAPRWGRRNRGIEVGGGILDWGGGEERDGG